MQSLIYIRKRRLEWREVPDAQMVDESDAIVRPVAVARCDLDNAFLRHDLGTPLRLAHGLGWADRSLLRDLGPRPFTGPFAYGHECVAEVVELGPRVRSVTLGELVVVPFQISCGSCGPCAVGMTASCQTGRRTPISMYGLGAATGGWGGAMTERLRVPHADHMLVPVPVGIDPVAIASASDNIPDGWRAVAAPLTRCPGAPVLVLGGRARSVGLYAVASAIALGAERVDYLDTSPERLAIATRLGAQAIQRPRRWGRMRAGRKTYPVVVDACGGADALGFAIRSLAPGGICTAVTIYFAAGTRLPMWPMYLRQGTLVTGLVNARTELPTVLAAIAGGRLRPDLVTGVVAQWTDAPEALLASAAKVVITRPALGAAPHRPN
jgi:threonine dehydrogenase-like Zn-dependent dehydrogenase